MAGSFFDGCDNPKSRTPDQLLPHCKRISANVKRRFQRLTLTLFIVPKILPPAHEVFDFFARGGILLSGSFYSAVKFSLVRCARRREHGAGRPVQDKNGLEPARSDAFLPRRSASVIYRKRPVFHRGSPSLCSYNNSKISFLLQCPSECGKIYRDYQL
jgi:hypothetical protein